MIALREAKPKGGVKQGLICVCKLQNFADTTNCFKYDAERAENAEECINKHRESKEDSMNYIKYNKYLIYLIYKIKIHFIN